LPDLDANAADVAFEQLKAGSALRPLLSRKSRPFERYMSRFDVAKSLVLAIMRWLILPHTAWVALSIGTSLLPDEIAGLRAP
jgi:hypothetical protein